MIAGSWVYKTVLILIENYAAYCAYNENRCLDTIIVTSTHVWETAEQQSEKEIENDEISDKNSRHEVGNALTTNDEDTIPHGLYPLSTEDSEHNHEAVNVNW